MNSKDFVMGITFLLQSTVGILANLFLLSYYLVLYYKDCPLKPTHLIHKHLIIANFLIILSKGVPHTMVAFGMKQLFSNLSCRFLFYVHRVGRSVSISFICLLSIFQAITISPRISCWTDLKVKAPRYIHLSISHCWVLYMVENLIFPLYVYIKWNNKNMTRERDFEYCSISGHDEVSELLYVVLVVVPEILFSLLIVWSSGSMVFILYRHKKQVQHLYSTNLSVRRCPETRATQSILVLVSTFVAFYTLSSILHGCIALLKNPSSYLMMTTQFVSVSFSAFSPFIISSDSTIPRFCFAFIRT